MRAVSGLIVCWINGRCRRCLTDVADWVRLSLVLASPPARTSMFQNLNKKRCPLGPMRYHHPSCREGKLSKQGKELVAIVPLGQEQEAGNRREQEAAAAARRKRTSTLFVASNGPFHWLSQA